MTELEIFRALQKEFCNYTVIYEVQTKCHVWEGKVGRILPSSSRSASLYAYISKLYYLQNRIDDPGEGEERILETESGLPEV